MRYLIGVDIGTSGTKTVLFDENGNKIRSKTVEYPMYQPKNGWAEQNPEDWYNAVYETLKFVSEGIENENDKICGIGLSGQMHGLVMLDKDNNVLCPSIIWCDQRTARECEEIEAKVGKERLIEITANPALTGFTASKISRRIFSSTFLRKAPGLSLAFTTVRLPSCSLRYLTPFSDR